MSSPDWKRVAALFEQASELPETERGAFLDRSCGGDGQLRAEVESLLAADEGSKDFLAQPALEDGSGGGSSRRPPPRRQIGPYRLLRRIGEGGMSTVYLAVRSDDAYRQEVAVKVFALGHEREDLLRRFRTERQILASLEHPSIARLLDGGSTDDGLPYIVMEHIEGEPIDRYCDRERLSVDRRIELFRTLCAAVHYAHQNLVVHRDIKPSNVLVTADGTPKLLDFGIAKLVNPERFPQTIQHTATGQRLMTPQFASPEQVQGAPITTASDVYSMGVLLYRLLTGHLPYQVASSQTAELEKAVLEEDPPKPSTAVSRAETLDQGAPSDDVATPEAVSRARRTRPDRLRRRLAGDLDNIVLKALRKEPRRRYGSIEQLDEDLRRYQEGLPVAARPATLRYRTGKFLRRHRFGVAAIGTILLLAVGLAVTMWLQAERIAHERDQARRERDKAQAVASFLEEIFRVSDPGEARGETVTAREILERGAERITEELADQPEIQAALAAAVGNVYFNLGLYARAEPLLRRSLEIKRRQLGDDHPELADSLSDLGRLLRDRGEFEDAEPLLEQALELRRRTPGDAGPEVAESLNDLGVLRREQGDPEDARRWLLQALELRRKLDQPERLAESLTDLSEVYVQIDDLPAAEALAREALEISRTLFGEVHPKVALVMNNLAVFLGIQGKYAEAEPLLREALEIRRKLFGDTHLLVAESYNNLGRLRQELEDLAAAQELYERGLEALRPTFPNGHWRLVTQLNNLGFVLLERGDFTAAEIRFREALDLGQRILGVENTHVGLSHLGLGRLRVAQGDPAAAERFMRRNLEIQRQALSDDHRRVADAESFLGECLGALGRFEEAETLLLAGYDKLVENLGGSHRRSLEALDRVIALYEAWGRGEDAAVYRKKNPP